MDQIFAVRQVIEKVIEKDKVVYAAFGSLDTCSPSLHLATSVVEYISICTC